MARIGTSLGYAIGYEEAGSGDKTPIVFLHGVGSGKTVWRPQLDYFARDRRAIAFDFPGYHESDPAPEGTSRDDYAAAILSAMSRLEVARAHICGLSLGGVVAIAMHHAAAERCASLILADTFAEHPQAQVFYDRNIEMSRTVEMRDVAEQRVHFLVAPDATRQVRREVIDTFAQIDRAAFQIGCEAVWLANQRDRIAEIQVPTLVVVGSEDQITPPELSQELVEMIPGSRFEVIDRAGHLSNLEKPDEFNALVDQFLASLG